MKKILFISEWVPPKTGGAGKKMLEFILRNKSEFDISLISSVKNSEFEYKELKYYYIKTYRQKSKLKKTVKTILHIFKSISYFKIIRNIDVIYVSSPSFYSFSFVILGKLFRKKILIVNTLVGHDDPQLISTLNSTNPKKYSLLIQYRFCNNIISVSNTLYERSGKFKFKANVIPRPIGDNFLKYGFNYTKNDAGINDDTKVILWCGGLNDRKGFDKFLDLIISYNTKYMDDFFVLIVGQSHFQYSNEYLIDFFIRNNFSVKKFKYVGLVSDTSKYFAIADVFVMFSEREGFGNVFLEAKYMNCKVLCKRIDGTTDMIFNDYKNVYIADDYYEEKNILLDEIYKSGLKSLKNIPNHDVLKLYSPQVTDKKIINLLN